MREISKINLGGVDYDIRDKVLTKEVEKTISDFGSSVEKEISELEKIVEELVKSYKPIVVEGDVINAADEEDITSEDNLLKIKNRNALNGMGYVILRANKTLEEQVTLPNTIYVIRYEFDLADDIVTLPNNSVLMFDGGLVKNGTLVGQNTKIFSNAKCFVKTKLLGSYVGKCHTKWFAETSTISFETGSFELSKTDVTEDLQSALDSSFSTIYFDCGLYYVTKSLVLNDAKDIHLEGGATSQYLSQKQANLQNKTIVFTDKNISLLIIRPEQINFAKRIAIHGGNFDVSLCSETYTQSVILVDITQNRKIWGLTIDTGIFGKYSHIGAPSGKGVDFLTDGGSGNSGYASMIRIGGVINWFNTAARILTDGTCWITDINIDSEIAHCATAIECNTDVYIDSSIQSTVFLTEYEKNTPVIRITGGRAVIGGMIWDLGHTTAVDGVKLYNNIYLAEIHNAVSVLLEGKIASIYGSLIDDYFSGDTSVLFKSNIFNTNREEVLPSIDSNCLEALHERGGIASIKTIDQDGIVVESPNLELENLFRVAENCVRYEASAYNENNVELTITLPSYTIVNLLSFGVFSTENSVPMESVKVRFIMNEIQTDEQEIPVSQVTQYISARNSLGYAVREIKITFVKVKNSFFISSLIGNAQTTGYKKYTGRTFLPISGGEVFGDTNFKKKITAASAEVGNLGIKDENGNIRINKSLVMLDSHYLAYSASPKKKPFIKFLDNDNPAVVVADVMIFTTYETQPLKYAIYRFEATGLTGNSAFRYYKIAGNFDYGISVYRKTDSNINYIIGLNNEDTSAKGATYWKSLSPTLNNITCISDTEDIVLSSGYEKYDASIISNAGSSRPPINAIGLGYQFFDANLGKPIWYAGNSVWVDSTGTNV